MIKLKNILSLLFTIIILPQYLMGQDYLFNIQHITSNDGLADLITTTITKDRKGYMWIGTMNGLNRYDGYAFKLYTKEKHGLAKNFAITRIQEDEDGLLWLFYNKAPQTSPNHTDKLVEALDIFNPVTEEVVSFDTYFEGKTPFQQKDINRSDISDPKNRVWIITKNKHLYLYKNDKFELKYTNQKFDFNRVRIDEADNIWLVGAAQILKIDKNGNTLETIELDHQINDIWFNKANQIQINIRKYDKSLFNNEQEIIRIDNNQSRFSLTKDGNPFHSKSKFFQYTYRDAQHNFYVETFDGIQIFNSKGEWIADLSDFLLENTRTDILGVFKDKDFLWLATSVGVVKVHIQPNPFKHIQYNNGLSDCRGITEDEQGNIYFLNRYLFKWQPKTQQLSKLPNYGSDTYAPILAENKIWCPATERIVSSDLNLKSYEAYPRNLSFNHRTTCAIKYFNSNLYLIGGATDIEYFDIQQRKIIPFNQYNDFKILQKVEIKSFYQKKENIFIATTNGIFLLQKEKGIIHHFSKANGDLPHDNILHLYEDNQGVFWLASQGGGLIRWEVDLKTKKTNYKSFTTEDGLSNDYLYAVYEDDYNNLWLSSDKGLMQIDKATFSVKTFLTQHGLRHNEFNFTAHHQANPDSYRDGTLYFGGLGGLVAFHPKDFKSTDNYNIPLRLSKVMVLENDKENITDKTKLLENKQKIIIKPSDKFLELEFTLLDFEETDNHLYAYKIEGYSNKWYYTEGNRLRITHLPYGRYTLRIKGKNIRKDWSTQELIFELRVIRPFYLRWWFLMIVTLLVASGIYFYIKWRERQLVQTQERLENEVKKRTLTIRQQAEELQALDKAKTRFFSNVTHEFRTPLTLIIGPLEQILKDKTDTPHRSRLFGILKNARQLLTLINQMLDLSKLEGQKMGVEISHGEIVGFTRELVMRFQPLTKKKSQDLTFYSPFVEWKTHFDKNKWNKIIYNLVSNAVKYTPENGKIEVILQKVEEQNLIVLQVKDNGMGIKAEDLNQIFDRFYQIDATSTRVQGGTGIGLSLVHELIELQSGTVSAESEIGKGTVFTVQLPVLEEEYTEQLNEVNIEKVFLPISEEVSIISKQQPNNEVTELSGQAIKQSNNLKLLLIEDNDEMRAYIRDCLDASKYEITEARDGEEGIDKAKEICPDLIISDIMMPKKNGYDVVREIRNDLLTSHIPIVLLTAKSSLESRLEGFKRGADAYLTKPFSPQELALRIQKLIEVRQLLRNRYNNGQLPQPSEQFEQEDKFVLELKAYITENLNNPNLNSDTIGRHFGISRTGLYNKLKALTGKSIGEHIRNIRMEKAHQLIQQGELNLSEIAYDTGFSSLSHFSRTFKKVYGVSPSGLAKTTEKVG